MTLRISLSSLRVPTAGRSFMRTTTLSIIALAGLALVLTTATAGHAAMARGGLQSAPKAAAHAARAHAEVRHVVDGHDGRFDGRHFDSRHFHHGAHGGVSEIGRASCRERG